MVGRALPAGRGRCWALGRSRLECWVQFWAPLYSTGMVILETFKWRAMMMMKVVEHLSYEELLWELGLLFLEKAQGDLSNMYKCQMEQTEEDRARLFLSDVQQKRTGSGHKLKYRTFHLYIWKAWEFLRFSDFLLQSCEVGRETICPWFPRNGSFSCDWQYEHLLAYKCHFSSAFLSYWKEYFVSEITLVNIFKPVFLAYLSYREALKMGLWSDLNWRNIFKICSFYILSTYFLIAVGYLQT